MAASVFDNKQIIPDENMLMNALDKNYIYLEKIREHVTKQAGEITPEWKFYGQKSGWILKLMVQKRNILFIIPCQGFFRVGLTFGQKATDAILHSSLPDTIKEELKNARLYAEGRTIQLEVNTDAHYQSIAQLIEIKIQF